MGPAPGFWRASPDSLRMYACYNSAACQGAKEVSIEEESRGLFVAEGRCAPHYTGPLCSECESDFSRNSQFECARCPPLAMNLTLLLLLGVFIASLMGLLIWMTVRSMSKPRSLFSSYVRLMASNLQLLGLLLSFRFQWPHSVARLLAAFSTIADAPSQILSLDCLLASLLPSFPRFYGRFLLYVVIFPALGLLAIGLVSYIHGPSHEPIWHGSRTASPPPSSLQEEIPAGLSSVSISDAPGSIQNPLPTFQLLLH